MSDPTAYHRKLAEAVDRAVRINRHHSRPRTPVDVILAVLASEGVVDPEIHRQISQGLRNMQQMRDAEHTKVEQLEAAVAEATARGMSPAYHGNEVARTDAMLAALRSTGDKT